LIPLETEADLISRLSKIESDAEYFFADVDETQGGEWKDLLESKLRFKWHNQFKNFDYFKNKQDELNPSESNESTTKRPSNLEL
jgi:pleiotropic regulator 1